MLIPLHTYNTHLALSSHAGHTSILKSIFYTKFVIHVFQKDGDFRSVNTKALGSVKKNPCFRELKMFISDFIHFVFFYCSF